jgi:hypothetical protein
MLFFISPAAICQKRETNNFTLYQGTVKNSYALEFPITISREGLIRVDIKSDVFTPAGHRKIWWGVHILKKGEESKILAWGSSNKPDKFVVNHAVDTEELSRGKDYIIKVWNQKNVVINCEMQITYPTEPEKQKKRPTHLSDLAISKITLNKECMVVVEVVNIGPGEVPEQVWTSTASASLFLFRNGKSWGGVTLKKIDPQRKLQKEGGIAIFISNIKLAAPERIKAVVDYGNRIKEQDETNNAKEVTAECPKN